MGQLGGVVAVTNRPAPCQQLEEAKKLSRASNNGNGNNVTATTPTTQSGTNQNNGTVTDGDGFIGNEGNENRNTDVPDMTMPTVTEYNTQARNMFDNVL